MPDFNIVLPSKPKVIKEENMSGIYEIDGLYPGYGHTLGNSLRRIILSSLPGASITSIKIDGVSHEFSTISGVKEDVINLILNLKKIRFKINGDESQVVSLKVKGVKEVTAADLELPGQVELINSDVHIASLTDKNSNLNIEINIEKGLGYIPKDMFHKEKISAGTIAVDAAFTPIRRVSYEVENMRVGDRTDYNRLRVVIQTDGSITPRQALENSIEIMIRQLKSVIGFKEETLEETTSKDAADESEAGDRDGKPEDDYLKTRIEDLNLSMRTMKALSAAGIRTIGGLTRKKESDLLELAGLGDKGIDEIKKALASFELSLKK